MDTVDILRYPTEHIKKDLHSKIVLLTGPRQVGKTWLSRHLFSPSKTAYLSYDRFESRAIIQKESWTRAVDLVVFDELHKKKNWKAWLKGIYDTEPPPPGLLVTGSACLEAFRRGGRESLAGRHLLYRLHPFGLKELLQPSTTTAERETILTRLLERGGFPEPYLAKDQRDAARWRLNYFDRLLREDLRDLTPVSDMAAMEYLVERLAKQVGSPVSYESLARDVDVHATTIKRWLKHLEALFIVFSLTPNTAKIKGSILKRPKYYFYDTGRLPADQPAARFENLVAGALRKDLDFISDTRGLRTHLTYLRNKQKQEVDFFVQKEGETPLMIECKLVPEGDMHFARFKKLDSTVRCIQLVREAKYDEDRLGYAVRSAASWLGELDA